MCNALKFSTLFVIHACTNTDAAIMMPVCRSRSIRRQIMFNVVDAIVGCRFSIRCALSKCYFWQTFVQVFLISSKYGGALEEWHYRFKLRQVNANVRRHEG